MTYSLSEANLRPGWEGLEPGQNDQLSLSKVEIFAKNTLERDGFMTKMTNIGEILDRYLSRVLGQSRQECSSLCFEDTVKFLDWVTAEDSEALENTIQIQKYAEEGFQLKKSNKIKQDEMMGEANRLKDGSGQRGMKHDKSEEQHEQAPKSQTINRKKKVRQGADEAARIKRIRKKGSDKNETLEKEDEIDVMEKLPEERLIPIFEHYCKMSQLRNAPTFDQIQHKTINLTMNQFLAFTRQMGLSTIEEIPRSILIDIYKKNSPNSKEITFSQFLIILTKIADKIGGCTKICQILGIDSKANFREKMKNLNIRIYKEISKPFISMKPYKFKFNTKLGENEDQMEEKTKMKKFFSERKLKLQDQTLAPSRSQVKLKRNKQIAKSQQNGRQEAQILEKITASQMQGKDSSSINEQIEKLDSLQHQYRQGQQPLVPSISSSGKKIPSIHHITPSTYAQIHRMKQENHFSRGRRGGASFLLNGVIEQAKLELANNISEEFKKRKGVLVDEIGKKPFDSNKLRGKEVGNRPAIEPRVARNHNLNGAAQLEWIHGQNRLAQLIQDGDEDEFLKAHLSRQKRNQSGYIDTLGERLAKVRLG